MNYIPPTFLLLLQLMKLMAVRRVQMATQGRSEVPLPPAPPPHPGYAPNAALHAIKRHAQEFANPKAIAVRRYIVVRTLEFITKFDDLKLFFCRWGMKRRGQ